MVTNAVKPSFPTTFFLFTFLVWDSVVVQLVSVKYLRLELMWLFLCFFLNSSVSAPKTKEQIQMLSIRAWKINDFQFKSHFSVKTVF